MDINGLFGDISNSIEAMIKEKTLDLSVVGKIEKLSEESGNLENYWSKANISINDAFTLFHASRNSRLILDKLKSRLIQAQKANENPSVLYDANKILPLLQSLLFTLTSLKERTVTTSSITLISGRLKALRGIATDTMMLPSISEEMKGLEEKYVKQRFRVFANGVREALIEAQGPS